MTRKQKVGRMSTLTGRCTSQKLGPSIFWGVFSKARKLEVGHPSTLTGHQSSHNICSTHPVQVAIDCVPAWQDSREGAFKSPPQVTQPSTEALPAFSGRRLHIDTHRSLNLPLEGRRPHIDTHRSLNLPQRPCRPSLFATWLVGRRPQTDTHRSLNLMATLSPSMIGMQDKTHFNNDTHKWLNLMDRLSPNMTRRQDSLDTDTSLRLQEKSLHQFPGGQLCCPLARLESRR